MNSPCISSDKSVVELSEDIIIEILHRLPTKSLARFECVCKHWHKYIADPSLVYSCRSQRWSPHPDMVGFFCQARDLEEKFSEIRFFFSSRKSSEVIERCLNEAVNFCGWGLRIIASSNGFILITEDLTNQEVYYACNPATRQYFSVPVTQTSCIKLAALGFHCKVDDPEKDVISFTIVRYALPWLDFRSSVTVESFSSETNMWTTIDLILDVPLRVLLLSWTKVPSAAVINEVFCWIDEESQIILYDSGNRRFWALQLTGEMKDRDVCALGASGGALYYALYEEAEITVWCLESNIRSQDVVWVRKYAANIRNALLSCQGAFGPENSSIEVKNIKIHPANPHIFYLLVGDKVVISYDSEKNIAELLYDTGKPSSTTEYLLFSYEWHQWPRII